MKQHQLTQTLLSTLYEDDDLLAVDKPAGIDSGVLAGQRTIGVAEIVRGMRDDLPRLEPANRLSRYESGVLVLAKNPVVARHIRAGLRTLRIEQHYTVVVLGKLPQARMTLERLGGTSRGHGRGRRQPARRESKGGPSPTSLVRIAEGPKRSLIKCATCLPTTHALKAQLRSQKLRALGDVMSASRSRPMTHQMTSLHLSQIGFHHPGKSKKITIRSRPPEVFQAITRGERDVTRFLQAALVRRLPFLSGHNGLSYRLLSGHVEDVPGLTAERFGDVVVLELSEVKPGAAEAVAQAARWYRATLGVKSVHVRVTARASSEVADVLTRRWPPHKAVAGNDAPEELVVAEGSMKFLVRPWEGGAAGLYLDHRDNRARLRAMSAGKDVLNLFAYTCGFSVAAALGGATTTTSVDLAQPALDWGRRNFELNGLSPDPHEFVQSDALSYFKRARKQQREFDLIIIDPPSFAHGRRRGQDFSVARDLPELVREAASILRTGGVVMISTNLRKLSYSALRKHIKEGATGRRHRFTDKPDLPGDFAVDPDHAKTMFVQFD